MQKILKKHKCCNEVTAFEEIITKIKKTTNKNIKIIFLAGINSLPEKTSFIKTSKILRTLAFLHLYEYENNRFDIKWDQYLFKILSFDKIKYELYDDFWPFSELKKVDSPYKAYILINYDYKCISKGFFEF